MNPRRRWITTRAQSFLRLLLERVRGARHHAAVREPRSDARRDLRPAAVDAGTQRRSSGVHEPQPAPGLAQPARTGAARRCSPSAPSPSAWRCCWACRRCAPPRATSFASTVSGVDLVVGARSGPVNLLLYSVFRVGDATANVSWDELSTGRAASRCGLDHSHLAGRFPSRLPRAGNHRRTTSDHYRVAGGRSLEFRRGARFAGCYDAVLGAEVAENWVTSSATRWSSRMALGARELRANTRTSPSAWPAYSRARAPRWTAPCTSSLEGMEPCTTADRAASIVVPGETAGAGACSEPTRISPSPRSSSACATASRAAHHAACAQ